MLHIKLQTYDNQDPEEHLSLQSKVFSAILNISPHLQLTLIMCLN